MGESSLRDTIEKLVTALEQQAEINQMFKDRIAMLEARMNNLYTRGVSNERNNELRN